MRNGGEIRGPILGFRVTDMQAHKPLGLESQVLHMQVALGDGYLINPKWRRFGQN